MAQSNWLEHFADAANGGDGAAFARCFTPDAVYVDGFYGPFHGREAIGRMLVEHFHGTCDAFHWRLHDLLSDGAQAYARYVLTYRSRLPGARSAPVVFEGMSRFELKHGLIAHYSEVFDRGVALVQQALEPPHLHRLLRRWAGELRTLEGLAPLPEVL